MNPLLPYRVPKLEAKHMCKGQYSDQDGRHCLGGWCRETESGRCAMLTSLYPKIRKECEGKLVCEWNDSHTFEESAALWNRTMLRLGYIDKGDHFEQPNGIDRDALTPSQNDALNDWLKL